MLTSGVADPEIDSVATHRHDGQQVDYDVWMWRSCDALRGFLALRIPTSLQACMDENDLLQETLAVAWRALPSCDFPNHNAFMAWMQTIARSRLADEIKRLRRQKRGGARLAIQESQASSWRSPVHSIAASMKTPSSEVRGREVKQVLVDAIELLPQQYCRVVKLRYLKALTVAETARQMDCSEQAVHMLQFRALRKLRQIMGNRVS